MSSFHTRFSDTDVLWNYVILLGSFTIYEFMILLRLHSGKMTTNNTPVDKTYMLVSQVLSVHA